MGPKNQPRFYHTWAGINEFLEILQELSEKLPEHSPYEIKNTFFKDICPSAFADVVSSVLVSAESACSEYKYDITDEAVRKSILGFNMTFQDLAESFEIIRGAKLGYQRRELEDMERKKSENSNQGVR